MPIIYSYPLATPIETDVLIGTRAAVNAEGDNLTVNFSMEGIAEFVAGQIFTGTAGTIPIFGTGNTLLNTTIVPISQSGSEMNIGDASSQTTIFGSKVELTTFVIDSTGSTGNPGQVLTSTATGTEWAEGADLHYVYTKNVPTTTWYIPHNLGKYPSVTVVNINNVVLYGNVEYLDLNTVQITFSAGFSGKAYLN